VAFAFFGFLLAPGKIISSKNADSFALAGPAFWAFPSTIRLYRGAGLPMMPGC